MANRQVRLDPDVDEIVASRMAEWGSSSASATVNRMLRQDATRAAVAAQAPPAGRKAQAPPARGTRAVGRPRSSNSQDRASARASAPKARADARCPHPITRRIGDHCANCGQKVA